MSAMEESAMEESAMEEIGARYALALHDFLADSDEAGL